MSEVPEFWRTEVWHPLSVHLPLALLTIATLFKIFERILKRENLNSSGNILLFIGTVGAWIAVYTGDLADGIVSRQICDPTILKNHENGAYVVAWLFTIASVVVIVDLIGLIQKVQSRLRFVVIALMLAGSGYLLYTGHLGAELVYQQGAGVYKPSEDCGDFQ